MLSTTPHPFRAARPRAISHRLVLAGLAVGLLAVIAVSLVPIVTDEVLAEGLPFGIGLFIGLLAGLLAWISRHDGDH